MQQKRPYRSPRRAEAARDTRDRVLARGRALFAAEGIDKVTMEAIATAAEVSVPTIYAQFRSKDGLLQAIMRAAIFGEGFRAAQAVMEGVQDARQMVRLTARVARSIYESEEEELGLMRGASAFSPALKRLEASFEALRYEMQAPRLALLFAQGHNRPGLDLESARRLMWMYTNREIHRMLVREGGWSGDRYEQWLAETLTTALCRPDDGGDTP